MVSFMGLFCVFKVRFIYWRMDLLSLPAQQKVGCVNWSAVFASAAKSRVCETVSFMGLFCVLKVRSIRW